MIYDRLAESIKSKIGRLESPDPRFLRHASPHPVVTDHTAILSSPETRITTLPNGLRVATESNLSAGTASISVWIDAGSRFEREEVNGVSNLLNRLALKGKGDNARVLEEMENIGGQLNGFTSREMTGYYVNLMNQSVARGIEILADVFQNSNFSESVISRERELIIHERDKVAEVADEAVFEYLHSTAFQYTQLGKSVIGSLDTLKSITNADIQEYISTQYSTHRMVVDASGAVKHEDVVEQVKKAFTKLSANPNTTSQLVNNEPTSFTGSEKLMLPVPLKSNLLLNINGASSNADNIGRQMLTYGGRIPSAELFARIDAVDANTVKRVAERFLADKDIAIAAMGPIQGLPDYNWFRRRTYWLRY